MTRFTDGPAKGQTLLLKRTPLILRVTECGGRWDALNDLTDTAEPGERLFVYLLKDLRGSCHLNFGGGRGGFYPVAEYVFSPVQPADTVMRDNRVWRAWCYENRSLANKVKEAA